MKECKIQARVQHNRRESRAKDAKIQVGIQAKDANTRRQSRRKMQYKLVIQANPGERCKIQVGHSGERQYNRAKVGSGCREKGNKLRREVREMMQIQ